MCVKALRCDLEDTVAVVSQSVKAGTAVNAAGETLAALADIPWVIKSRCGIWQQVNWCISMAYPLAGPPRLLPKVNGSTRTTSRILQRSCVTAMQKNFGRK